MSTGQRSFVVVVAILVAGLAACAPSPSPSPSATTAPTVTAPLATPSPSVAPTPASPPPTAPPAGSPSPSEVASPSASPSNAASPPPPKIGDFTMQAPPATTATWTGIQWQRLATSNPLAHVRSVTRWTGGFLALGDLVVDAATAHTKVWISADGRRWDLLDPAVFGPTTFVVSAAPTSAGIVVLTLQGGSFGENGRETEADGWTLQGPWQTWTSTDGTTWTAHPGPDFTVPSEMTGVNHPELVAGGGGHGIALAMAGQPLAFSPDGFTWTTVSLTAFPGGPAGWSPGVFAPIQAGFVAIGTTATGTVALTTPDGQAWHKASVPTTCPAEGITVAASGLIVEGSAGEAHNPKQVWCASSNGTSWTRLVNLPPLGYMQTSDECRGTCQNGLLADDGERMLAYRGYPKQVGWTSRDGRHWTPLTFASARLPGWTSNDPGLFDARILPIGLIFIDEASGTTWFGQPRT